jgi:tetratricopeptide (TPR) repeat protein
MRAPRHPLPLLAVLVLALPAAAPLGAEEGHGEVHGRVEFPTSCSPAVEARFERAVAQLHSFGYEFARSGFEAVAADDPECGMAYWGAATTWLHPLWAAPTKEELAAGRAAAERAAAIGAPSERERGWIAAIGAFYAESETVDHRTRAGRYRDALAALAEKFPDDHEARIFHALMLLGTAPPSDKSFAQQKQAVELLRPFVAEHPDHPGVAHYLIHSLDYPELAHLALDAARRYARIAPGSSHALHMPSHIFVRLGLWPESIASNLDSANAAIRTRSVYPEASSFDELHALDYLEYAYLQTGQDEAADQVLERALELAPAASVKPTMAAVYALAAIPARQRLERGDWAGAASIADTGSGASAYPYADAIGAYARAVGAARGGDPARAERGVARLAELQAQLAAAPPPGPYDWAGHVEAMRLAAAGLAERARGRDAEAVRLLGEAAALDAKVGKHPVTPGTVLPPRELLGELLLDLGRPADALREFEAVLVEAPNRLRALSGAAKAAELARQDERARTLHTLVVSIAAPASQRPEVKLSRAKLASR